MYYDSRDLRVKYNVYDAECDSRDLYVMYNVYEAECVFFMSNNAGKNMYSYPPLRSATGNAWSRVHIYIC